MVRDVILTLILHGVYSWVFLFAGINDGYAICASGGFFSVCTVSAWYVVKIPVHRCCSECVFGFAALLSLPLFLINSL